LAPTFHAVPFSDSWGPHWNVTHKMTLTGYFVTFYNGLQKRGRISNSTVTS
jgi:hypothetical protein